MSAISTQPGDRRTPIPIRPSVASHAGSPNQRVCGAPIQGATSPGPSPRPGKLTMGGSMSGGIHADRSVSSAPAPRQRSGGRRRLIRSPIVRGCAEGTLPWDRRCEIGPERHGPCHGAEVRRFRPPGGARPSSASWTSAGRGAREGRRTGSAVIPQRLCRERHTDSCSSGRVRFGPRSAASPAGRQPLAATAGRPVPRSLPSRRERGGCSGACRRQFEADHVDAKEVTSA